MEDCSVSDIIKDALLFSRFKLNNDNIDLKIDLQNPDQLINCHKIQISQVILNLISNAHHAINDNGRLEKNLIIKSDKQDGFVRINIEDNGNGVSGDIDKIFDPFYNDQRDRKRNRVRP